jgi:hypothetical protein
MQILKNKKKPLSAIFLRPCSNCTSRWSKKKRSVIGFSVIVAGEPESGRSPED